jgi:hypothetical protein
VPFAAVAAPLVFLMVQPPDSGSIPLYSAPREIRRVYWELIQTTEIWVRLVPEDPQGKPPLFSLTFQALFPGRPERDPYTGLPKWPQGVPERLTVRAEPYPLTLIRELSLRLVIDGRTLDLTAPGSRYRNLPCLIADDTCAPNAVEAEIEASLLRSLITARAVRGEALGFTIDLTAADQLALQEFATRVGLSAETGPGGVR